MNGIIYKAVNSITKEEILATIDEYEIIDTNDTEYNIYEYNDFLEDVNNYYITNYDGSGNLIINDKLLLNTSLLLFEKSVYFENKLFVPFNVLYNLFGENIKFAWFNK